LTYDFYVFTQQEFEVLFSSVQTTSSFKNVTSVQQQWAVWSIIQVFTPHRVWGYVLSVQANSVETTSASVHTTQMFLSVQATVFTQHAVWNLKCSRNIEFEASVQATVLKTTSSLKSQCSHNTEFEASVQSTMSLSKITNVQTKFKQTHGVWVWISRAQQQRV